MDSKSKEFVNINTKSIINSAYLEKKLESDNKKHFATKYSQIYGFESRKKEIEELFIDPLIRTKYFHNRRLLIRGQSGVGKSFLINSICLEYNYFLTKCKATEFKDVVEKKKNTNKCVFLVTCLDNVEDQDVINDICEILQTYNNIFVIAEVIGLINPRFKNYKCFEDELILLNPDLLERKNILRYCSENLNLELSMKEYQKEDTDNLFLEIAEKTTGYTISEICILFRKALRKSKEMNESLNINHFIIQNNSISQITFDDIGGLKGVKKELKNCIIDPIINSEKYKAFGLDIPTGILLYGPSGCGKTMIAKAIANMQGFSFLSVKGPELISKYVGESEKEMRELFEKAKQKEPCVIFFDELDSIFGIRGSSEHSNRIVNQLLSLLDGVEGRGKVYVIGATNRIDCIDKAFLRTGRFDKMIKIPLPDFSERKSIFIKITKKYKIHESIFFQIDTKGFSSADLAGLVNEVKRLLIQENINTEDLETQIKCFNIALENFRKMKNHNYHDIKRSKTNNVSYMDCESR